MKTIISLIFALTCFAALGQSEIDPQTGPARPYYGRVDMQFTNTVVTGTNYLVITNGVTVKFTSLNAAQFIPCGLQRNIGFQIETWGNGAEVGGVGSNVVAVLAPTIDGVNYDTNHEQTITCPEENTSTNTWTTNISCDGIGGFFLVSLANTGGATNTVKFKYSQKLNAP